MRTSFMVLVRRFSVGALLCAAAASCSAHHGGAAPSMRWAGPTPLAPPPLGCVRWFWSGSALDVRFEGTALGADFTQLAAPDDPKRGESRYAVQVDGVDAADVTLALGDGLRKTLVTGLVPGPHHLRVRRRTEAQYGPAMLCALRAPDGHFLPMTAAGAAPLGAPVARRLVIFGDSITAGYGNLCPAATVRSTAANQDALRTYGALAATAFGADYVGVAWSGAGVWRNGDGAASPTLPDRWAQDAASWAGLPAAETRIVVNLGTNDFRGGPVDDAAFVAAYLRFIGRLHSEFAGAPIWLAVGPMLSDAASAGAHQLTHARRLVREVADAARAQQWPVHLLQFATQEGALGFGCDYHPNVATHAQMARTLTAALQTVPGW